MGHDESKPARWAKVMSAQQSHIKVRSRYTTRAMITGHSSIGPKRVQERMSTRTTTRERLLPDELTRWGNCQMRTLNRGPLRDNQMSVLDNRG